METRYSRIMGTPLTSEELAMIEFAREFDDEWEDDIPEISPETTPELYNAMMAAVAERNQRVSRALLNWPKHYLSEHYNIDTCVKLIQNLRQ